MSKRNPTRTRRLTHHPGASTRTKPEQALPRRSERALALRLELGDLRFAILGARMLSDITGHGRAEDAEDAREAPSACSAVLAIVAERLHVLDSVLAGDVEVGILGRRNIVAARLCEVDDEILIRFDRAPRRS